MAALTIYKGIASIPLDHASTTNFYSLFYLLGSESLE